MMALSKKKTAILATIDGAKLYDLDAAVKLVQDNATAKFDETIELAVNLGVDPRHSDQQVRKMVALPNGTGKKMRIAVFARGDKAELAKKAGADVVGAEDLMESMQKGDLNYDRVIATPDMMAIVGRVGKILGPKGLMPNPKLGTVTPNVEEAVNKAKAGEVECRVEKAGIVHVAVGKASFDAKKLSENISTVIKALQSAKPSGAKGGYMKRAAISSTMGGGVKLDLSSFKQAA
ncbi:MAG: 50S ribosomal protein L1 [Rickettsiales bacterium]|nr:50S ribosomal protein L1 [Rickettsiales bacterium]